MKTKTKALLSLLGMSMLTSCKIEDFFIFGGTETEQSDIETFEGCKNVLFFALYNYYGYEGQHFTNKWLGMNDALKDHGITVTGYEGEKDARKFTITREATCDLPEDAVIYMVNNQNWDAGIQFSKPFSVYHPMAVISTCNGVEFASAPILSVEEKISNATMGGFSDTYRQAFVNGSLTYLVAKYTAHILPIFAACINALDNGGAMRNEDGTALQLSITQWAIQTLAEYDKMDAVDSIDPSHPTLRKINIDKFFDKTNPSYGAKNLQDFVKDSSKENVAKMYEENGANQAEDEANFRKGKQYTCGIIAPSSVNDQVQKYIDFIRGYLATAYNCIVLPNGSVTSTNTQDMVATQLCNQGADFIISLQDDTDRNKAAKICNDKGVYFAIAGSCQNDIDYKGIKDLPYYVGSIGTSIQEERRAAKEMTEYYLQCMIHREAGDLEEYQKEVKGLNQIEETLVYYPFDKERGI
ncbi:MAG: hypothetical protein SOW65_02905 [Candidatus Enterosoma sp.]|nr:hypothetical protein [Bacilli bacterium]MDD7081630.1 hypothetical protein [bacterium]MDY2895715.1 hypothetical protein [Candidatus Enterosoma sp.]MCI6608698.1 hypothetical protein [Bacilli bacterium]MCI7065148.1 hypothetical protein [Bacilli bacterium]